MNANSQFLENLSVQGPTKRSYVPRVKRLLRLLSHQIRSILAEGAIKRPMTLCGGVLFAS
jgi:hypothetical protein